MKGSIAAATIVWVAAGAFCLGQKPEKLNIQVTADKLEGTATLYGSIWFAGSNGMATVSSTDPKLKIKPTVPYTITGSGKMKTLVVEIDYTKPTTLVPASELTLTGVKDAKGGTAVMFKGQVPEFRTPAVTGADTGTATLAEQTSGGQKNNAENGGDPGQTKKDADADKEPARSGLLLANLHDWLLYGDTAALGLLFVGGIFLWRKGRPQPDPATVLPTMVGQPDVDHSPSIKQAKNDAQKALAQAAEAKRDALAAQGESDEIGKQLKGIQREVATLRGLRLDTMLAERKEGLRSLAEALDELPLEPSAAPRSGVASAQREEAAAAAIVNRWLSQGAKDRGQLLALAGELELAAELMNHKDLNRVFDDLTTFEYPFAVDADGPWLWVSIAGSQDFWAVPADAAFFGMGRAPSLLERLFEGMQNANQGFQFRAIYKPCRLRPVAGNEGLYTVVSKGLLRLEGAATPVAPVPKDFDSLVPEKASSPDSGKAGSNPSKRLAAWIRSTSRQLREQGKRLELASAAQKVPGDFLSRREFKQQLDGVQRQLAGIEAKLRMRPVTQVTPPPAGAASVEEKTAPVIASRLPESVALQPEPEPAASVSVAGGGAIAEGWQEALRRSAEAPGSEPETTGVPSDEVYVQRARNLAAELRKLDAASGAAVVHLKRDPMHEAFEVHETEANGSNPREVVCITCNAAHTWQLAVCMGGREREIAVLYPLGGMSKGKYLSGYTGLIADLPMASFTIAGIEEPARLRPGGGPGGTYTVARKMRLAPAVSGEAAR